MNPECSRSVAEFPSLRDGFERSPCLPFIVRHAREFLDPPFEKVLERFKKSSDRVFGYDDSGDHVEGLRLSTLVEEWLGDRLEVKVLDSPVHIVDLPPVMDEFATRPPTTKPLEDGSHTSRVHAHEHGQSPVLTCGDTYTPFHVDPPLFGGGWMYLWRGGKTWHFVSQAWITTLFTRDTNDKILDASIEELATIDPAIECFAVTAGNGDFVYFPPGWIHRVWTREKSLGIGGYIRLEGAGAELLQATAQLEALGKDYGW